MGRTFLNRICTALIAAFLLLGVYGCDNQPQHADPPQPTIEKILRIGIVPELDVFSQKKRYEPVADYISRKLGINVQLVMLPRYGDIIDNFTEERLDGAFFGSFTAAVATEKLHVIPVARPERKDGTSTYYGIIFVRKDSGIHNAEDMKGKRFVFVDKATTAGYLLPLHYFQEQGITYHNWFQETYFAGTHENAIYDVLTRRADIGAAKNSVFNRLARKDNRLLDDLEILTTSPAVPENGLAVKADLDGQLRNDLKDCLLEMDKDPQGRQVLDNFGAWRFIESTRDDYQPVFDYADTLGLGVEANRYHND